MSDNCNKSKLIMLHYNRNFLEKLRSKSLKRVRLNDLNLNTFKGR